MKGADEHRMSLLPYWDQNVDLDVVNWLPYCLDFNPVSVNGMYSETLRSIAALSSSVTPRPCAVAGRHTIAARPQ